METKKVIVSKISCGHCTAAIERELSELDGIGEVKAEVESKEVTISWQSPLTWETISETLEEIGYPAD